MSSNVVSGERPERGRGDLVRDMSSFPICSKKKGVGNGEHDRGTYLYTYGKFTFQIRNAVLFLLST